MYSLSEILAEKFEAFQKPKAYYSLAAALVLGTFAFHSIPNYQSMQASMVNTATVQEENTILSSMIIEKKEERARVEAELKLMTKKHLPEVEKIFPATEDIGKLTRFLENYALDLEKTGMMNIKSLSFGVPKSSEEYNILPFSLSFESNDINFIRFMNMISKSGSFEDDHYVRGDPVRLMRVDEIDVQILNMDVTQEEKTYAVNLKMSTFFQK